MLEEIVKAITALKAAIYIRVSTEYQVDKDSLQVQKRELAAYCEMVLGIKDYVIFEDPGYSAKNTDRPDYQRMMDRVRAGEFSHILVWKLDRISRNLLDFSAMYAELKHLGVTFVSKNEQFDTSSAIGEAMLKIILVFAELERNMTSERVTAVMLSRANNKQWNGGRIPYGYEWDKTLQTFGFNDAEARVVKKIYDMYEEYQSILYIARYLNNAQIYTRGGKEWSITAVHKILTNPFYIGTYVYNVHSDGKANKKRKAAEWVTVPDHHIALIQEEQFNRVGFMLKRNRRGGVPEDQTYIRKNIHIFSGITKCRKCGSLMSATLDKRRADGWRPSIYGCSRRRKNSQACDNKYISDAALGPFVFNYVANIIRAKNECKRYSPETIAKKLLKGDAFAMVDHIGEDGLQQLSDLFCSGATGLEYKPAVLNDTAQQAISERDILMERKRKAETALARLDSVYYFSESGMPEAEYIVTKARFTKQLNEVDERLSQLSVEDHGPISDEAFLKKASYFIMVEKLLEKKTIDYEKYIRTIDQSVPMNFIKTIIDRIEVEDGRVASITFKNGMRHEFFYKGSSYTE